MPEITQRTHMLEKRILELEEEPTELRIQLHGEEITDYALINWQGQDVKLSTLFGCKDQMVPIHDMGFDYKLCTMRADSFNAVYDFVAQ